VENIAMPLVIPIIDKCTKPKCQNDGSQIGDSTRVEPEPRAARHTAPAFKTRSHPRPLDNLSHSVTPAWNTLDIPFADF
jgi:hypothetical protein